jgi:acyl-CoA reductase-like NAD-dependent aldehyde dehydrogenase
MVNHGRVASMDSGKPMVDAAFGEVMVTCEKLAWLIKEGERYLRPERRSSGVMVSVLCLLLTYSLALLVQLRSR